MRLVLDTNVVVAGLLWDGPPRKILERAIDDGTLELYSSPALIDELRNTLGYRKFARRIADHRTSIDALLAQYRALLILVSPLNKPRAVPRDPDDNEVLALAVAAQVDLIVSGDDDLLSLEAFRGIRIARPAEVVRIATAS
jgi:putative PIN family toxin of toxin-antitoxin system